MPIVWLPFAVQDIIHIRIYIADKDPKSAQNIALRIDKAVNRLSTMPNLGRPGRISGTRELIVSNTPYLAVYRVQNNRVEILRVLHGRQPFPDAL
jgi:toxin ParE1/3/4